MYESLIPNFLYYYLKKQRWKIFILIILIPLSPLTHTFWNTWHSCYYHNRSHICSEWSVFLGVGDVDTSSITSVFYWRGFNYKETLQPFLFTPTCPLLCEENQLVWLGCGRSHWESVPQPFPLLLKPSIQGSCLQVCSISRGKRPDSWGRSAGTYCCLCPMSNSDEALWRWLRLHIYVYSLDWISISNKTGILISISLIS